MPGPTFPSEAIVPENASPTLIPHISTSVNDTNAVNRYNTIYRKTDEMVSSSRILPFILVLNIELGCSLFWNSPYIALIDIYALSALIPPVVEPEQPQ